MKATEEQLFKQALLEAVRWQKEFSRIPRSLEDGEYRERKEKRFDWLWSCFKSEREFMNKPLSKTERLRQALLKAANWEELATEVEYTAMVVSEAQLRVVDRILNEFMLEPVIDENPEPEFDILITGQDTRSVLLHVLEQLIIFLNKNDWLDMDEYHYGKLNVKIEKV